MARDIEDFLRRAAERRKQNPGQSAPIQPPPKLVPPRVASPSDASQQPEPVDPYRELPRSLEAGQKRPTAPPQAPPVSNPTNQRSQKRGAIADHTRDAMVERDRAQTTTSAHQNIGLAGGSPDQPMTKFDHEIGGLKEVASIQSDRVETEGPDKSHLAIGLLDLFKQPQTVRQSILISEILKRPNFDD